MFHVGQKVVCIDARTPVGCTQELKPGGIYTIADISEYWDGIGIRLVEIKAEQTRRYIDAFRVERFRPIVEKKTDISVFTDILDRVNKSEREPVSVR